METNEASVISAGFIVCLAFTGLVEGTVTVNFRKLPCDKANFDAAVYEECVLQFNKTMAAVDYQLKCPWPTTREYYIYLMNCLEHLADITRCPHADIHKVLLEIHQLYYSLCSYMMDPEWYILLLLILPCIIITLMIPFLCQKFRLYEYKLPKDK